MNTDKDRENKLTLDLLDAIEQRDDMSQRHLAQHMGVALGLTNTYLKRCVKKGWIKITTAPANRYLYYLTPKGFAEKARLTGEFLATSLTLVKQSGDAYLGLYEQCLQAGHSDVVFVGLSDLTELAYLRSLKVSVTAMGVYNPVLVEADDADVDKEWYGLPVHSTLPLEWQGAVLLITALENTADLINVIEKHYPDITLMVPEFLVQQSNGA
ncbi:MAG: winged helix-turn-helix transcriptional regulator [Arenicella sp.]